jgi:ferrochelatase
MNLGSPDSTKVKDVRKYLGQFLMDGRVIDVPAFFRALLVKGIIVPFRAPKSAKAYKKIWTDEGAPLILYTEQLARALQKQGDELYVYFGMRYGNPAPQSVYKKIQSNHPNLDRALVIPLYPHYAMSSYETAVVYAEEEWQKGNFDYTLDYLGPIYKDTRYIHALAESIRPYLDRPFDKILFSYHGIPKRHIMKGDCTGTHCFKVDDCCHQPSKAHAYCYRHQCITTTEEVTSILKISNEKWMYSFQSRLGSDEWLKPYTAKVLEELPKQGVKNLLVACPAFVSDCLETIEEISMEGKEEFLKAGGAHFEQIPCLNVNQVWVDCLEAYINDYFSGDRSMLLQKENLMIL